jgi:site-specific DNA-methyltransferase (adenine-specific)
MSGGNKPSSNGDYQILSSILILSPNEVCSETYLVIDAYNNEKEAKNLTSYLKTKTLRFLLLQSLTSIHITRNCFQFVPLQDFSHPWTDAMLYEKYGLTQQEIDFIESMIRPME